MTSMAVLTDEVRKQLEEYLDAHGGRPPSEPELPAQNPRPTRLPDRALGSRE